MTVDQIVGLIDTGAALAVALYAISLGRNMTTEFTSTLTNIVERQNTTIEHLIESCMDGTRE